jgi:hypothetical protein
MIVAGLIVGVIALLVAAGATYLSPLCTPCAVLLFGAIAGFVAGVIDKPLTDSEAKRKGAIAGAIGGAGAVIGQMIGTAINVTFMGPEGASQFNQTLGLPSGGPGFNQGYWVGAIGGAVCFSLLDLLFMAGAGFLGGLLWWQMTGKKMNPPSDSSPIFLNKP